MLTDTLYPIALAEHIVGADQNSGQPDARLFFGESTENHLGTDGDAGDRLDFITLAVHELGHVFGFDSTIAEDGTFAIHRIAFTGETRPIPARSPTIYTRFVDCSGMGRAESKRTAEARSISRHRRPRWVESQQD
ncbi:MAG TPA: hypothetical protein VNL18_09175 [Gemmatimonadales bacterium]|nr:hypothetical protein [Gemmatimonadales bacterium]